MDKNKFKQLLEDYLAGRLSAEDRELLQRWYDSFGESASKVPGLEDEQAVRQIQDELNARIRGAIQPPVMLMPSKRKPKLWRNIAAAAILVGLISLLWDWGNNKWTKENTLAGKAQPLFHEVRTGVRQIKKLSLPDGSLIHLNANSVIRIPMPMNHDKRAVFLDEGEAYFEVARDSIRPFQVHTNTLQVEVLGTAFGVKAYQHLADVTVAVQQGRVRVSDPSRVLGELTAEQGMSYRKGDKQVHLTRFSASETTGWIKGLISLEKAGFEELALAMYNLYGVRLKSQDPRTSSYRYHVNLHADRPLEETLEVINSIHRTKYRRKGNEITIYP